MSTSLTGKPVDLDGERVKPLELASKKPLESPGIARETYAPTKKPRREAGAFHSMFEAIRTPERFSSG
jgi:hypothetical protein